MTAQTTAAALVDEMIATAKSEINLVNSLLSDALQELERRGAKAQMDLLNGLGISDTGIIASAAKVERMVERRTKAYQELRSLEHVRKAC
jgi:hypothetical protein